MYFYNNYAAVRLEIGDIRNIKIGQNRSEVQFLNGSKIVATVANDNARGLRCNILILDEFRMIKKEIVDKVFKPMLNVKRQPPYLSNPKYEHLQEENKQIYMSSAWYRSHWIWTEFQRYLRGMLDGKDYYVASLPWQLAVHHNLLDLKQVAEEKDADDFDDISFQMEYDALFPGENERGFFKLDAITRCRYLSRTFVPPSNLDYVENKHKSKSNQKALSNMPRKNFDSEVRIIGLDIALMGKMLPLAA